MRSVLTPTSPTFTHSVGLKNSCSSFTSLLLLATNVKAYWVHVYDENGLRSVHSQYPTEAEAQRACALLSNDYDGVTYVYRSFFDSNYE